MTVTDLSVSTFVHAISLMVFESRDSEKRHVPSSEFAEVSEIEAPRYVRLFSVKMGTV